MHKWGYPQSGWLFWWEDQPKIDDFMGTSILGKLHTGPYFP